MKYNINFIYVLLFPVLFSCSSAGDEPSVTPPSGGEPTVTPPTSTKWTFSYSLSDKGTDGTRAAGSNVQFDQLAENTRVGLFCVQSDGTLNSGFNNLKYKPTVDKTLEPDEGVEAPSKPSGECKIIACAPYSEAFASLPEELSFSVKSDQTTDANLIASDLLWAETDVDEQVTNVDIDFQRILPRWVLKISISGQLKPSDFQGATFAIFRIKSQTEFNANTGKVASEASGKNGIIPFLTVDALNANTASEFVGTVIIPPQTSDACYLQIVFRDGVERYFKFNPIVFRQGKRYYSEIQLASYNNELQADIKSWEENNIIGFITSE